jgi:hypothetical protein
MGSYLWGSRKVVGAKALEAMTGNGVRLLAKVVEIPSVLSVLAKLCLEILLGAEAGEQGRSELGNTESMSMVWVEL